ncbi:hypothetical protein [Micromonospora sp. CB01531]|uniref:hypothetical protein n=1 Tax=Micromonospora sp. CB01531 TaxID=1718947 RepID=UPI0009406050|nr:hypothetical protein [Micromonospora sp. CB01531]OKI84558.1 hypothetical protein A6A27_40350 [Micromonospora sp. CB01531]
MLAALFAVTVRHRRLILSLSLVLAVGLAWGRRLSDWLDLILLIATILTAVLGALALRRSRPAALLVKPEVRAFATAPSASQILIAVTLTFLTSHLLGTRYLGEVFGGLFMVLPFLLLVAVGVQVASGWRGISIELRPEGVCQRDVTGSLMVPWEALAPGRPFQPAVGAATLALTYAQPDLVRRRGILPLGRRRLRIDNVHPWFIADAIRYYVDHPQHRAAIGEPSEYQRLWHALMSAPTGLGHGHAS